jgi:hypothetical protein
MPQRWLQIKGDPVVPAFLFQQERVESLFDTYIDRVHRTVHGLLTREGLFHNEIHYPKFSRLRSDTGLIEDGKRSVEPSLPISAPLLAGAA